MTMRKKVQRYYYFHADMMNITLDLEFANNI